MHHACGKTVSATLMRLEVEEDVEQLSWTDLTSTQELHSQHQSIEARATTTCTVGGRGEREREPKLLFFYLPECAFFLVFLSHQGVDMNRLVGQRQGVRGVTIETSRVTKALHQRLIQLLSTRDVSMFNISVATFMTYLKLLLHRSKDNKGSLDLHSN